MIAENFGFVKEKNELQIKEMIKNKNKNKLRKIHIDIYQENPLVSSSSFSLLLRTSEDNAIISFDNNRLTLRRNDRHSTYFMNVLLSKITECFSKITEEYYEFILKIQNVFYKITIIN